ncbi:LAFA_0D03862g1_1 [Lachancea sp. 'fantastica']|nr:LAFA_0D03862g1_1 [Lachancea sp. 'fantastica']
MSSTKKTVGEGKGLETSIWAIPDSKTESSEAKSARKPGGRRRSVKTGQNNGQSNDQSDAHHANVNALAARLGMVDIGAAENSAGRKKHAVLDGKSGEPSSKHFPASGKKKANPLAMRLGMVDVGEEGEASEDSGSEALSRPSTSDKSSIFDRIKPKPQRPTAETRKPAESSSKTPHASSQKTQTVSPSKKSDILKRKIEEQRKIRDSNIKKAQQLDLLQDFLKNDDDDGWEEDL